MLGYLLPTTEARREAKYEMRRERRSKIKRRVNSEKASLAAVAVLAVLNALAETTTSKTAATTASLLSYKYTPTKKRNRKGKADGPKEEKEATTMMSKSSKFLSKSLSSTSTSMLPPTYSYPRRFG